MNRIWAVLLVVLTGCSATMVTTRGGGRFAPVNDSKGGTVEYSLEGARSVVEKRRQDAYRKMHAYCGGAYKITSESLRKDGGSAVPIGGVLFYGEERHNYIDFECVAAITPANPTQAM